jgi:hypothetical protein
LLPVFAASITGPKFPFSNVFVTSEPLILNYETFESARRVPIRGKRDGVQVMSASVFFDVADMKKRDGQRIVDFPQL